MNLRQSKIAHFLRPEKGPKYHGKIPKTKLRNSARQDLSKNTLVEPYVSEFTGIYTLRKWAIFHCGKFKTRDFVFAF